MRTDVSKKQNSWYLNGDFVTAQVDWLGVDRKQNNVGTLFFNYLLTSLFYVCIIFPINLYWMSKTASLKL